MTLLRKASAVVSMIAVVSIVVVLNRSEKALVELVLAVKGSRGLR